MIAATLANGQVVSVDEARGNAVSVTSLDRNNIGQSYVGGKGYVGTRFATINRDELNEIITIDPDACDEYQNWLAAMSDVDDLADDHSPDLAAALALEDQARQAFVDFIHTTSLARAMTARENTPEFEKFAPICPAAPVQSPALGEGEHDQDLLSTRLAV